MTPQIDIPDTFMGRKVDGAIERVLAKDRKREQAAVELKQVAPIIQSNAQFWLIDNVSYRNKIYTVQLAKSLLDNGAAKTQEQWAEYSKQAKQNSDFYVGDMPLYHAVFSALSKSKNKEAEEAREFINSKMHEKWLMTLTKITYVPKVENQILHNFGMHDEYVVKGNVVGPDEYIANSKNTNYLEAILGTANVQEINKVYQWLNSTDAYIWRLNNKPEKIEERVARFNANSGRSVLICYGNPLSSDSALGVRKVAPIAPIGAGKN